LDKRIEDHVVDQGWFTEPPARASGRWTGRGIVGVIFGGIALVGFNLPRTGWSSSADASRPASCC
jgi:hypothetical protein